MTMGWSYSGQKEAEFAPPPASLDAPASDQVEARMEGLEGADKEQSASQPPNEPAAKKQLLASPGISAEWQSPHPYPQAVRYLPRSQEELGAPVYVLESPPATQSRGRKSSSSCNSFNCLLMAVMTLNTLAVCLGLWQLRQRTSQMIHAHEAAIGELSETIRNRVLPLLEQDPDSAPLTLSPDDPHTTAKRYDWTESRPSHFGDQFVFTNNLSRLASTQLGSPELPKPRKQKPPGFLLSPTIPASKSPPFKIPSSPFNESAAEEWTTHFPDLKPPLGD